MKSRPQNAIPLDRRDGGPLNWFDYLDSEGRVPVEFFGKPYPKTDKQREAWLIDMLRSSRSQGFFCRLLARKGLRLDFQMTESRPTGWPDSFYTLGTVPLAQLFSLPNENPAEELAQMKAFLTWLDEQIKGRGENGNDASLQVFRAGHGRSCMNLVHFQDEDEQKARNLALQEWRNQPWFEAWHRKMMEHLGRVRLGPYCGFTLTDLQGDREYLQFLEQMGIRKEPGKTHE